MNIESINNTRLEIDEQSYFQFSAVVTLAENQCRGTTYRFWQAVYNILSEAGQEGLPHSWPELFHQENRELGMTEFERRFDIVDDYIIPKPPMANVPAMVV